MSFLDANRDGYVTRYGRFKMKNEIYKLLEFINIFNFFLKISIYWHQELVHMVTMRLNVPSQT